MEAHLTEHISSMPIFKILRYLTLSNEPVHLRKLSKKLLLSPAGVSDILNRLKESGVLKIHAKGNKKIINLIISADEKKYLNLFFEISQANDIKKRAEKLDVNAMNKFNWMDETYKFYKSLKNK